MSDSTPGLPQHVLVCFAVKQEAAPLRRRLAGGAPVRVLLTGMGLRKAREAIIQSLDEGPTPGLVLTSGFAGGLKADLARGTVLFEAGERFRWERELQEVGSLPGSFHCAERVASTASDKYLLRQQTGADAVEMESLAIHEVCRHRGIPCATVRVVLDTALEDLPLDFSTLLDPDGNLAAKRLAWAVLKAPGRIPALLRLGRQSAEAAERLADVLEAFLLRTA
jgi:hypothetical protein